MRFRIVPLLALLLWVEALSPAQNGPNSFAAPEHRETPAEAAKPYEARLDPPPAATASTNRPSPVTPVTTTVEVVASDQTLRDGISVSHDVTRDEILSSAGTFGDFSRYLQVLPGVSANNDFTNEIRVRGGDPAENLFVVDGIEIPNINHFALEGTSGGFTSMLDTSDIEGMTMTPGNYDARFSTRLSSLVEIRTRERSGRKPARQIDFGISGIGGFVELPASLKVNGLLSFHRSMLNMVTDDIGINGVPIYTNGLGQAEWEPTSKDRVTFLDLAGGDSIRMTPQPCDPGVSSPFRTEYGGVRSTAGVLWEHYPNSNAISSFGANYSSQDQNIGQDWQINTSSHPGNCKLESFSVYQEGTRDRIGTLSYRASIQKGIWLYSFGSTGEMNSFAYQVAQPQGAQSPFSTNPTWTDADNFNRAVTVGQYAQFAEATGQLASRLTFVGGVREEEFGLTGAHILDPRASLALRLTEHQAINLNVGRSGQLAPTINILSYAQNARLAPMEVTQMSLGTQMWSSSRATISMQGYAKRYTNEPVSTEYPSLMLANMVDTLGQQFVWLPLKTGGRGESNGVELTLRAHTASRFKTLSSLTYSRTRYAAADGVMRPGNFDYPLVANVLASYKGFHGIEFSARDSFTSGHPYTPFDVTASEAQSRGIYDLTKINALRANAYNRLDLDLDRDFHPGHRDLNVHAGVENALNRKNFMGNVWLDSCHPTPQVDYCGQAALPVAGLPEIRINQMHIFPDVSLRYMF